MATRERQGTKIPITPHIRENCLEGFRGSGVKHDQACRGRRAITIRIAEFERGNRNQDCTMNAYPVPQPRTSHSVWWCGPPPHGLHVLPMVRRDLIAITIRIAEACKQAKGDRSQDREQGNRSQDCKHRAKSQSGFQRCDASNRSQDCRRGTHGQSQSGLPGEDRKQSRSGSMVYGTNLQMNTTMDGNTI